MDTFAYTCVELKNLEILAKTFNIPARQEQLTQENIFNSAPVRRIAIAMITRSASTGSYSKTHSVNNSSILDKV